MTKIKCPRSTCGAVDAKMGRGGESLRRILMEEREEKQEKGRSRRMRVGVKKSAIR